MRHLAITQIPADAPKDSCTAFDLLIYARRELKATVRFERARTIRSKAVSGHRDNFRRPDLVPLPRRAIFERQGAVPCPCEAHLSCQFTMSSAPGRPQAAYGLQTAVVSSMTFAQPSHARFAYAARLE